MESEDIEELPDAGMEPVGEPGKVRLILDKGWRLGKKIAITGVAISTAPILLPPLMIFSAFGLAFSVPFGLVFAGYACTDKIMRSLLLPRPHVAAAASPEEELYAKTQSEEMKQEGIPVHEYEVEEPEEVDDVDVTEIYEDGEGAVVCELEEQEEVESEGFGYAENELMVTEEKKQQADGVGGIPDDEGVPLVEKEEDVKEITKDKESRLGVTKPPKDHREKGSKVHDGEVNVKGISETDVGDKDAKVRGKENITGLAEDDKGTFDVDQEVKDKEGEENVKDVTEGGNATFDNRVNDGKFQGEVEENVKGIARPENAAFDVGDLNKEEKGQEGEERVKEITKDDRSRLVVGETRKDEYGPKGDNKTRHDTGDKKMEEVQEGDNKIEHDAGDIKKGEETQGREASVKEISEADDYGVPSVVKVSTLKEETGVPKPYTLGTDEIDVGTDSSYVGQLEKSSDRESSMPGEVAPFEEKPSMHDSSMPTKVAPLDEKSLDHDMEPAEDSETSSKPVTRVTSGKQQLESPIVEELHMEEKIWEQIDAVRTIVGYKATVHASYVEELKALYLFTGVEPPATFKDPSDLAEVNDKLCFLKSVIGVK